MSWGLSGCEMNTFNSQKYRNRNRQTDKYIHYTITLSELRTLIRERGTPAEQKCRDPYAGLQVSPSSAYEFCHRRQHTALDRLYHQLIELRCKKRWNKTEIKQSRLKQTWNKFVLFQFYFRCKSRFSYRDAGQTGAWSFSLFNHPSLSSSLWTCESLGICSV